MLVKIIKFLFVKKSGLYYDLVIAIERMHMDHLTVRVEQITSHVI